MSALQAPRLDLDAQVKRGDNAFSYANIWIGTTQVRVYEARSVNGPYAGLPTGRVVVEVNPGDEPLDIYYDNMSLSD